MSVAGPGWPARRGATSTARPPWRRPARAGLTGREDAFRSAGKADAVARDAAAAGLTNRSAHVLGAFHDETLAARSADTALTICDALLPHAVTRVIWNPDPRPGGAPKTDAQLRIRSRAVAAPGDAIAV